MGWLMGDRQRLRDNVAKARGALHGEPVLPVKPAPPGVGSAVRSFSAARMTGGRAVYGGTLDVTPDNIVFRPIDVDTPVNFLSAVLPRVGVPGVAVRVGKAALDATGLRETKVIPRSDVASVTALSNGGLTAPPSVRVTLMDGQKHDFGIVKGQAVPSIARSNRSLRDTAAALLNAEPR